MTQAQAGPAKRHPRRCCARGQAAAWTGCRGGLRRRLGSGSTPQLAPAARGAGCRQPPAQMVARRAPRAASQRGASRMRPRQMMTSRRWKRRWVHPRLQQQQRPPLPPLQTARACSAAWAAWGRRQRLLRSRCRRRRLAAWWPGSAAWPPAAPCAPAAAARAPAGASPAARAAAVAAAAAAAPVRRHGCSLRCCQCPASHLARNGAASLAARAPATPASRACRAAPPAGCLAGCLLPSAFRSRPPGGPPAAAAAGCCAHRRGPRTTSWGPREPSWAQAAPARSLQARAQRPAKPPDAAGSAATQAAWRAAAARRPRGGVLPQPRTS
jgi:hypothetical protein